MSLNNAIVEVRGKHILSLLKDIILYLMRRLNAKRKYIERWFGDICLNVFKLLEKKISNISAWIVDWTGLSKFEVKTMYGDQFVGDLATRFVFIGGGSS